MIVRSHASFKCLGRRILEIHRTIQDAGAVPRWRGRTPWIVTSYLGEGLPFSVMHQMATEYLTTIRVSNLQVGATSLLHIGTALKLLCGPLVDLYGTKRRWMIAMLAAIGVAVLVLASLVGQHALWSFWLVLGVISMCSAMHDVACDGTYIVNLDRQEQAAHQGTRTAAFRVAMLVGGSGLVYVAGRMSSWRLAFLVAGALVLGLAVAYVFVLPRRPGAKVEGERPPAARGAIRGFFESYKSFFTQPHAAPVLFFVLLYRLGDVMMFSMSKPLQRDLGVPTETRGLLFGFGVGVFLIGSFLAGLYISRRGLARSLVPMTYIQNFSILLYAAMAYFRPSFPVIVAVVLGEQLASSIGVAANMVFLIQRCKGTFSASHFGFVTALVGLMSTLAGFAAGWLDTKLGHAWFFTLCFVATFPGLILVWLVPRTPIEAEGVVTR
jgi:MFS transporter, PAT family, beta-lactamase induction signal transducer AmpG